MDTLRLDILKIGKTIGPYLVLIITALVHSSCLNNGWVNWDDPVSVLNNSFIKQFNWTNIYSIFSKPSIGANYTPFAHLSWMFDYAIGGLNPFTYHLHNLLLHLVNTFLVYRFIKTLTSEKRIPLLVMLLFGIHPMNVEVISWITARKDLLSAFYYLLALNTYCLYLSHSKMKYLFITGFLFLGALFSKGVAVTFPITMLILDFYYNRQWINKVWLEKIPFFTLSIIFGCLAIFGQYKSNSINLSDTFNIMERVSYGLLFYTSNLLFPVNLSAFHPVIITSIFQWLVYLAMTITIIFLGYKMIKYQKNKQLIFGGLFFIITILPVIQLIPIGKAIVSERYVYLPYLGLFFILVTGFFEIQKKIREQSVFNFRILVTAGIIIVITFSAKSYQQHKTWENGESLWSNVIKQYPDHHYAYNNLGNFYREKGEYDNALHYLNRSLEINPLFYESLNDRGMTYNQLQQFEKAIIDFNAAIQISNYPKAYANRGIAYFNLQKYQEALNDFNQAIAQRPNYGIYYYNRARLYQVTNQKDLALADFRKAVQCSPENQKFQLALKSL